MKLDQPRFDSDRTYEALVKAGEDWADKQAAADLLEETRKSVLAKLINEAEGSVNAREYKALADQEYRDFVAGMVTARKAANKARVRYDSAKILAEMRRSEESTRRAEMTLR
jgi:hypothetical protein